MNTHHYYNSKTTSYNWSNGVTKEILDHSIKEWLMLIAYSIFVPMLLGNIILTIRDQFINGIHLSSDSFFYIIGYISSAAFLFASISELGKRYLVGLIIILSYFYYLFIKDVLAIDSLIVNGYFYTICIPAIVLALFSIRTCLKKTCNDAVNSLNIHNDVSLKDKKSRLKTIKMLLANIDYDEDKLGKLLNLSKITNDIDVMMMIVAKFKQKAPQCTHGIANHFIKTDGLNTYYYLKDNGYFKQDDNINMFRLFNLFIDLYDDKQEELARTIYKDIAKENPNFAIDIEQLMTIWCENGNMNYNCEVMHLISRMPYHEKLKTVMRYLIMSDSLIKNDGKKEPKKLKI